MDWRPEKWENPFDPAAIRIKDRNGKPISHHEAFEAGANAMLEALLNTYSITSKMVRDTRHNLSIELPTKEMEKHQVGSGKWVFIPDKE